MLRSRKDKESKNLNRVIVQVGNQQLNKDILDFVVYNGEKEYTINELLSKVIALENENKTLKKVIKAREVAESENTLLITKALELLSTKVAQAEDEISNLKNKTRYL